MTPTEAAEILAAHNAWRRDDTTDMTTMADPTELGHAIDVAVRELAMLPAIERERDNLRARMDRAVKAAEEHFGEDAIRYKFSLNKRGWLMTTFPQHMDGNWYALQRADDDAHIGLALRCKEAETEVQALRRAVEQAQDLMHAYLSHQTTTSDRWKHVLLALNAAMKAAA